MRVILNLVHYIMKLNQTFPIFQHATLKNVGRPGYKASTKYSYTLCSSDCVFGTYNNSKAQSHYMRYQRCTETGC